MKTISAISYVYLANPIPVNIYIYLHIRAIFMLGVGQPTTSWGFDFRCLGSNFKTYMGRILPFFYNLLFKNQRNFNFLRAHCLFKNDKIYIVLIFTSDALFMSAGFGQLFLWNVTFVISDRISKRRPIWVGLVSWSNESKWNLHEARD